MVIVKILLRGFIVFFVLSMCMSFDSNEMDKNETSSSEDSKDSITDCLDNLTIIQFNLNNPPISGDTTIMTWDSLSLDTAQWPLSKGGLNPYVEKLPIGDDIRLVVGYRMGGGTSNVSGSLASQEMNFQNSTTRTTWFINGKGAYSSSVLIVGGVVGSNRFTTHHSFGGSILVTDNRRIYSEICINSDSTYQMTHRYNSYTDNSEILATSSGTLNETQWANARLGIFYFFRGFLCPRQ